MTWKWRWGASVLPVLPSRPSTWPVLTLSPGFHFQASRLHVGIEGEAPTADIHHHVIAGSRADGGIVGKLARHLLGLPILRGHHRAVGDGEDLVAEKSIARELIGWAVGERVLVVELHEV